MRRVAISLMAVGGVAILFGVFYVLEAGNGPGTGPKTFAQRRSYNQVKEAVHESFPLGMSVALLGLGAVVLGKRMYDKHGRGDEAA